jgi:hypothetical protein
LSAPAIAFTVFWSLAKLSHFSGNRHLHEPSDWQVPTKQSAFDAHARQTPTAHTGVAPEQSAELAQTTQVPAEQMGRVPAQVAPLGVQPVRVALQICGVLLAQLSWFAVQTTASQVPALASHTWLVLHTVLTQPVPVLLQTSSVLPVHFICVLAVQTTASQVPAVASHTWLVLHTVSTQPVPVLLHTSSVLPVHFFCVLAVQTTASHVPALTSQY